MGRPTSMRMREFLLETGMCIMILASPALLYVAPMLGESWWLKSRIRAEFHHPRPLLEAIVRKIDAEVTPRGVWARYRLAGRIEDVIQMDSQADSDLEGTIFVQRQADGQLRVSIRMFCRARLGLWSLNYSSRP